MRRNFNNALVAMTLLMAAAGPALARGNDLVVTDGMGEQVQIKHGFFGHNTKIVKDRLGDGYGTKTGWFGTKEQQVNVLGNTFDSKKGIFGGSTVSGHDLLGDKITTKKGIFGRRTTYVDASGAGSALQTLWNKNKSSIMGGGKLPGGFGGSGNGPYNSEPNVQPSIGPDGNGAPLPPN